MRQLHLLISKTSRTISRIETPAIIRVSPSLGLSCALGSSFWSYLKPTLSSIQFTMSLVGMNSNSTNILNALRHSRVKRGKLILHLRMNMLNCKMLMMFHRNFSPLPRTMQIRKLSKQKACAPWAAEFPTAFMASSSTSVTC